MSSRRKTIFGDPPRGRVGHTAGRGLERPQSEADEFAPRPPGRLRSGAAAAAGSGQEEEKTDRYLLTYADLITLLLGLFIVLYAVSKVDGGKYQEVAGLLERMFGGKTVMLAAPKDAADAAAPLAEQAQRAELIRRIQQAVGDRQFGTGVTITRNERGITIHMLEQLLFTSGSAAVKPSAYATLDSIASVIRALPNDVRVEGHTDNVPIATREFPSNWHLSVSRAVNTAFYLITRHGLNPDKIAVVGYSEFKPLAANTTAENRARNRRVDIVILDAPEPQRPQEQKGRS